MKIMKKKLIILLLLFSLSNPALVENSEKKEDFDKNKKESEKIKNR